MVAIIYPLLVGSGLAVLGGHLIWKAVRMRLGGVMARGIVVAVEAQSSVSGKRSYYRVVEFETGDGRIVRCPVGMGSSSANSFTKGKAVTLYYSPDVPEKPFLWAFWDVVLPPLVIWALAAGAAVAAFQQAHR